MVLGRLRTAALDVLQKALNKNRTELKKKKNARTLDPVMSLPETHLKE